jgi:hypothetical protein
MNPARQTALGLLAAVLALLLMEPAACRNCSDIKDELNNAGEQQGSTQQVECVGFANLSKGEMS